jgi:hypothetical protein
MRLSYKEGREEGEKRIPELQSEEEKKGWNCSWDVMALLYCPELIE